MRQFLRSLVMVAIIAVAGPALGQAPVTPPVAAPAPNAQPATDGSRNTAFDFLMAFTGMGLVLLVVCYPSRRY